MKNTKKSKEKEYVDPILIKEGLFKDEEDYIQTMDKVFKGLAEAAKNGKIEGMEKPTRRSAKKRK